MKEKKIAIKYFLNKNLNPLRNDDGSYSDKYPLYIQITYNRISTQMKTYYGQYCKSVDEFKAKHHEFIAAEEKLIRKIIHYKIEKSKDNFTLKGFYRTYNIYSAEVSDILCHIAYHALLKTVNNIKTNNDIYNNFKKILIQGVESIDDVNIKYFFYAGKKLFLPDNNDNIGENPFQNIDFKDVEFNEVICNHMFDVRYYIESTYKENIFVALSVISWIDGSLKNYTTEYLKKKNLNKEETRKIIDEIDYCINEYIIQEEKNN